MSEYKRPPRQFTLTLGQVFTPTVEYVFRESTSVLPDTESREAAIRSVVVALDEAYGKLKGHYLMDISTKTFAP